LGFASQEDAMPTQLLPIVRYGNFGTLRADPINQNVIVPPIVVPAPEPIILSNQELQVKAKGMSFGANIPLKYLFGLTDSFFRLTYFDKGSQWRMIPKKHSPNWQFTGGIVMLEIVITVYLDDRLLGTLKSEYAETLSHEYMHVEDEVDIGRNYLPKLLPTLPDFKRMLIQDETGAPEVMSDDNYRNWFVKTVIDDRGYTRTNFEHWIYELWCAESDRRAKLRDAMFWGK
jgi:hypothetical protein